MSNTDKLTDLKSGDFFEDLLVVVDGRVQTQRLVNGLPCNILGFGSLEPFIGDVWRLRYINESTQSAACNAELHSIVTAADGLTELYQSVNINSIAHLKRAQRLIDEAEQNYCPDSIELALAIFDLAFITSLPGAYRYNLARRILPVCAKKLDASDRRILSLRKAMAFTAPENEKEARFLEVLASQDLMGDAVEQRACILGNLGNLSIKKGNWQEGEEALRRALAFHQDAFLQWRLAECLAKLGRFEEAYNLLSDFPGWHFAVIEGEYGEARDQILREPRRSF